jgi:hypothetical protein
MASVYFSGQGVIFLAKYSDNRRGEFFDLGNAPLFRLGVGGELEIHFEDFSKKTFGLIFGGSPKIAKGKEAFSYNGNVGRFRYVHESADVIETDIKSRIEHDYSLIFEGMNSANYNLPFRIEIERITALHRKGEFNLIGDTIETFQLTGSYEIKGRNKAYMILPPRTI